MTITTTKTERLSRERCSQHCLSHNGGTFSVFSPFGVAPRRPAATWLAYGFRPAASGTFDQDDDGNAGPVELLLPVVVVYNLDAIPAWLRSNHHHHRPSGAGRGGLGGGRRREIVDDRPTVHGAFLFLKPLDCP